MDTKQKPGAIDAIIDAAAYPGGALSGLERAELAELTQLMSTDPDEAVRAAAKERIQEIRTHRQGALAPEDLTFIETVERLSPQVELEHRQKLRNEARAADPKAAEKTYGPAGLKDETITPFHGPFGMPTGASSIPLQPKTGRKSPTGPVAGVSSPELDRLAALGDEEAQTIIRQRDELAARGAMTIGGSLGALAPGLLSGAVIAGGGSGATEAAVRGEDTTGIAKGAATGAAADLALGGVMRGLGKSAGWLRGAARNNLDREGAMTIMEAADASGMPTQLRPSVGGMRPVKGSPIKDVIAEAKVSGKTQNRAMREFSTQVGKELQELAAGYDSRIQDAVSKVRWQMAEEASVLLPERQIAEVVEVIDQRLIENVSAGGKIKNDRLNSQLLRVREKLVDVMPAQGPVQGGEKLPPVEVPTKLNSRDLEDLIDSLDELANYGNKVEGSGKGYSAASMKLKELRDTAGMSGVMAGTAAPPQGSPAWDEWKAAVGPELAVKGTAAAVKQAQRVKGAVTGQPLNKIDKSQSSTPIEQRALNMKPNSEDEQIVKQWLSETNPELLKRLDAARAWNAKASLGGNPVRAGATKENLYLSTGANFADRAIGVYASTPLDALNRAFSPRRSAISAEAIRQAADLDLDPQVIQDLYDNAESQEPAK